jgi:hypothetical protein
MATVMRVAGDEEAMATAARVMAARQCWRASDGDVDEEGDDGGPVEK